MNKNAALFGLLSLAGIGAYFALGSNEANAAAPSRPDAPSEPPVQTTTARPTTTTNRNDAGGGTHTFDPPPPPTARPDAPYGPVQTVPGTGTSQSVIAPTSQTSAHASERDLSRLEIEGYQRVLRALQYRIAADGLLGPATRTALRTFIPAANRERGWNLPATGELDPATRTALGYYGERGYFDLSGVEASRAALLRQAILARRASAVGDLPPPRY